VLKTLDLRGKIVTGDAMFAQRKLWFFGFEWG
jgi:predicted transposase YbfD/YdcC